MTFKDRHALETLPKQIAAAEAEVARLQKRLADPDLYRLDQTAFCAVTDALAHAQASLTDFEERWLALELMREQLEA